ncbi:MAG TPA: hypothetical protein DHV62_08620 [Elusimicrobia bacterium]|jgi:peroxiredoxin|nr:hypothetical protein [Elusimicrobiota bacterium]
MNLKYQILTFLLGIILGIVLHYTGFCVYGSLAEWLSVRSARRLLGVVVAMLIFATIHFWGFQGNLSCGNIWKGYLGLHSFLGGFLQGVGYVLITACPLTLLVRLGQGSKLHLVAFGGFLLGAAFFGHLRTPLVNFFSPFILQPPAGIGSEIVTVSAKSVPPSTFSIPTIDNKTFTLGKAVSLIYVAPECCPFCHPEAIEMINHLSKQFSQRGLVTIAIFRKHSIEEIVKPFIKKYNLSWLIARDPEFVFLKRLGINKENFFVVILVDKEGKIILKQEDFNKADFVKYKKEIEKLLSKK